MHINIIISGVALEGDSSSTHKANALATIEKLSQMENDLEIIFKKEKMEYLGLNHDDALVIFMRMVNALIKKVMINIGSSTNMFYFDAFQKFGILTNDFTPMTSLLIWITGNLISPLGIVNLYVTFGDKP